MKAESPTKSRAACGLRDFFQVNQPCARDVSRFPDARHVSSYCGLVPGERSSGASFYRGRIT